ncbi:hypothetical protein ERS043926_01836, partial [Streptococcus pneumoniae]
MSSNGLLNLKLMYLLKSTHSLTLKLMHLCLLRLRQTLMLIQTH